MIQTPVEFLQEALKIHFTHEQEMQFEGLFQQAKEMFDQQMIEFAEFVGKYPDKNRNFKGEILHAKSKYDGAERTIDLLEIFLSKKSDDDNSKTEMSINELKTICQSVIDNTPSDATEKEIGYTKAMEHIIKILGGKSHKYSQTEISDKQKFIDWLNLRFTPESPQSYIVSELEKLNEIDEELGHLKTENYHKKTTISRTAFAPTEDEGAE